MLILATIITATSLTPAKPVGPAAAPRPHYLNGAAVYDRLRERRLNCGVNCLYLIASLAHKPTKLDDLEKLVPPGDRGISLPQLRDAAARIGLNSTIRRYSIQNLIGCNRPFIAHFAAHRSQSVDTGHFVVVSVVDDRQVTFIDGTTGEVLKYNHARFSRFWGGYVLEFQDDNDLIALGIVVASGVILILMVAGLLRSERSRAHCRTPTLAVAFVLCVQGNPGIAGSIRGSAHDQAFWRTPKNDLAVCEFLFLRTQNKCVRLETLIEHINARSPRPSLVDARETARRFGIDARLVASDIQGVHRFALPVIVHLDDPNGGAVGEFVLVHSLDETRCGIVRGAVATLDELSIDEFRRRWSGLLVGAAPRHRYWWLLSLTFGCLVMLAYGLRLRTGRR